MSSSSRVQGGIFVIDGKKYPVYIGVNTVGRNRDAVINIKNIGVSQFHAALVLVDRNQHLLSDLKSSNGTLLNNEHITPLNLYNLETGAKIKFADIEGIYTKTSTDDEDVSELERNASQIEPLTQTFYEANTQVIFEQPKEIRNLSFSFISSQKLGKLADEVENYVKLHDAPTQIAHTSTPGPSRVNNSEYINNQNISDGHFEEIVRCSPIMQDVIDFHEAETQIDIGALSNHSKSIDIHEMETQIGSLGDELSSHNAEHSQSTRVVLEDPDPDSVLLHEADTQPLPTETDHENSKIRENVTVPNGESDDDTLDEIPKGNRSSTKTGEIIDETVVNESASSQMDKVHDDSSNSSIDFMTMQKTKVITHYTELQAAISENTVNSSIIMLNDSDGSSTDSEIVMPRRKKPVFRHLNSQLSDIDSKETNGAGSQNPSLLINDPKNSEMDMEIEITKKGSSLPRKKIICDSSSDTDIDENTMVTPRKVKLKKKAKQSDSETENEDSLKFVRRRSLRNVFDNDSDTVGSDATGSSKRQVAPLADVTGKNLNGIEKKVDSDCETDVDEGIETSVSDKKKENDENREDNTVTKNDTLNESDFIPATQDERPDGVIRLGCVPSNIGISNNSIEDSRVGTQCSEDSFKLGLTQMMDDSQGNIGPESQSLANLKKFNGGIAQLLTATKATGKGSQDSTSSVLNLSVAIEKPSTSGAHHDEAVSLKTSATISGTCLDAPAVVNEDNIYDVATQKLTDNKDDDIPEEIYLQNTQKINEPGGLKKIEDDNVFAQPYRKSKSPRKSLNSPKPSADAKAADDDDDDIFNQPSQRYDPSLENELENMFASPRRGVYRKKVTGSPKTLERHMASLFESQSLTEDIVGAIDLNRSKEKLPAEDSELEAILATQRVVDSPKTLESQMENLFATQSSVAEKIFDSGEDQHHPVVPLMDNDLEAILASQQISSETVSSVVRNTTQICSTALDSKESQLEVTFPTQTVRVTENDSNRPANPLVVVFDEDQHVHGDAAKEIETEVQETDTSLASTSKNSKPDDKNEVYSSGKEDEVLKTSFEHSFALEEAKCKKMRKSSRNTTVISDIKVSKPKDTLIVPVNNVQTRRSTRRTKASGSSNTSAKSDSSSRSDSNTSNNLSSKQTVSDSSSETDASSSSTSTSRSTVSSTATETSNVRSSRSSRRNVPKSNPILQKIVETEENRVDALDNATVSLKDIRAKSNRGSASVNSMIVDRPKRESRGRRGKSQCSLSEHGSTADTSSGVEVRQSNEGNSSMRTAIGEKIVYEISDSCDSSAVILLKDRSPSPPITVSSDSAVEITSYERPSNGKGKGKKSFTTEAIVTSVILPRRLPIREKRMYEYPTSPKTINSKSRKTSMSSESTIEDSELSLSTVKMDGEEEPINPNPVVEPTPVPVTEPEIVVKKMYVCGPETPKPRTRGRKASASSDICSLSSTSTSERSSRSSTSSKRSLGKDAQESAKRETVGGKRIYKSSSSESGTSQENDGEGTTPARGKRISGKTLARKNEPTTAASLKPSTSFKKPRNISEIADGLRGSPTKRKPTASGSSSEELFTPPKHRRISENLDTPEQSVSKTLVKRWFVTHRPENVSKAFVKRWVIADGKEGSIHCECDSGQLSETCSEVCSLVSAFDQPVTKRTSNHVEQVESVSKTLKKRRADADGHGDKTAEKLRTPVLKSCVIPGVNDGPLQCQCGSGHFSETCSSACRLFFGSNRPAAKHNDYLVRNTKDVNHYQPSTSRRMVKTCNQNNATLNGTQATYFLPHYDDVMNDELSSQRNGMVHVSKLQGVRETVLEGHPLEKTSTTGEVPRPPTRPKRIQKERSRQFVVPGSSSSRSLSEGDNETDNTGSTKLRTVSFRIPEGKISLQQLFAAFPNSAETINVDGNLNPMIGGPLNMEDYFTDSVCESSRFMNNRVIEISPVTQQVRLEGPSRLSVSNEIEIRLSLQLVDEDANMLFPLVYLNSNRRNPRMYKSILTVLQNGVKANETRLETRPATSSEPPQKASNRVNLKIRSDLFRDSLLEYTNLYKVEYEMESLKSLRDLGSMLNLSVSSSDSNRIKKLTADELPYSEQWLLYTAGKITPSQFKACCRASVNSPPLSLINSICYPVPRKAQICGHKSAIFSDFKEKLAKSHRNFSFTTACGVSLNPDYPYFLSLPDGFINCGCCGFGCIQMKCDSCDIDKFKRCLNVQDGVMGIDKDDATYYETQMHMAVTKTSYCYCILANKQSALVLKVFPGDDFWHKKKRRAKSFFHNVILPELLGKFYSKNYSMPALVSDSDT